MEKHAVLTRIVAIIGTLLVWLPLLAPFVFGLARLVVTRRFLFDYLMPAEFFPVALIGCVLLIVAAWRAGAYRRLVIGGSVAAVVLLVVSQWVAVISGLASGRTEPQGAAWAIVIGMLILYVVSLAAVGAGGAVLVRRLSKRAKQQQAAAAQRET